jgi:hypothetical protein
MVIVVVMVEHEIAYDFACNLVTTFKHHVEINQEFSI